MGKYSVNMEKILSRKTRIEENYEKISKRKFKCIVTVVNVKLVKEKFYFYVIIIKSKSSKVLSYYTLHCAEDFIRDNFQNLKYLFNLFYATGLFLYPPKTSENIWFSDVFRGYKKVSCMK